jgi:hypothetical protein
VCQAWHRTHGVEVPVPGLSGAEGEEKGTGVPREVASGGSPIHTCGATHRNRIGGVGPPGTSGHVTTKSSSRVWGVLDTSGVDARTVRCLTLGGLQAVRQRGERSAAESEPPGRQQSAEGLVGPAQARLVRHPTAERRGHGEAEPPRGWAAGPNGGQEGSPPVGPRPRTCTAAGAARRGAEG